MKQYQCQYIQFPTRLISSLTLSNNWGMKISDLRVIEKNASWRSKSKVRIINKKHSTIDFYFTESKEVYTHSLSSPSSLSSLSHQWGG